MYHASSQIDEERWAHYLAPQLTGRAQLAFAALPTADSAKYDAIKQAILQWYDINEEVYRRRFRLVVGGEGETNREYVVRLLELEKKWLKKCDSLEKLYEVIGLEQFLNMCKCKLWRKRIRDRARHTDQTGEQRQAVLQIR